MDIEKPDSFYKHSVTLLILTHIGSAANLLFHMCMGRLLVKEQYGILVSLMGIVLIFSTPLLALQNTIAHFTRTNHASNTPCRYRQFIKLWIRRISIISIPFLLLVFVFRVKIAGLQHLNTVYPVFIVACLVVLNAFIPIFVGFLQGLQRFVWMPIVSNTWALFRLIVPVSVVYFWVATANAAMSTYLMGVLVSLGIGLILFLSDSNSEKNITTDNESHGFSALDSYFLLSVIALFLFSAIMNGDVILVKAFFPSENDYGIYNRASTIARTLIFLSQPLALVLFPKVTSSGTSSRQHTISLLKAISVSVFFVIAVALTCFLFPQLPVMLLYGRDAIDDATLSLVRRVVFAMAPTGITQVLVFYEMAQKRFSFILPLAICATGMFITFSLWHTNIYHSSTILAVVSYTCMFFVLGLVLRTIRRYGVTVRP